MFMSAAAPRWVLERSAVNVSRVLQFFFGQLTVRLFWDQLSTHRVGLSSGPRSSADRISPGFLCCSRLPSLASQDLLHQIWTSGASAISPISDCSSSEFSPQRKQFREVANHMICVCVCVMTQLPAALREKKHEATYLTSNTSQQSDCYCRVLHYY